jgi:hypothetical protein
LLDLRAVQDDRLVLDLEVHVRHLPELNGRSSGAASNACGMWWPCRMAVPVVG